MMATKGDNLAHPRRDHDDAPAVRIAMWSGPRNISTAMMRSWGSRADTVVCDEPLYARWLKATGTDHPGATETIAACDTSLDRIIAWLTREPMPAGKRVFYQKHMAHHVLADDDLAWTEALKNCFLIRDPALVIASYTKIAPNPTARDLGLPQQLALFTRERERLGVSPPVLDADEALRDPATALRALCGRVDVEFDDAMLSWAPGPRTTDGVWGKHWYASVHKTTGFGPPRGASPALAARLTPLLRQCEPMYRALREEHMFVGGVSTGNGD